MLATSEKLKRLRAFAGLSSQNWGPEFLEACSTRIVTEGTFLTWQGEPAEYAFGLLEGHARLLTIAPDGRRQVLTEVAQGGVFNLSAVFGSRRQNMATSVMTTAGEVLLLPADALRRRVDSGGELALVLLQLLADENVRLTGLVEDLALRTVRERLARFVLELREHGDNVRWTHQRIAERIGTVREVVSRGLRSLAADGIIELRRHQVVIVDENRLRQEAGLQDS